MIFNMIVIHKEFFILFYKKMFYLKLTVYA